MISNLDETQEQIHTAIKQNKFKNIANNQLTTSSTIKKKVIRPTTIKQLMNLIIQETEGLQEQSRTASKKMYVISYVIMAKIYQITLQNHRYHISCSDETYFGQNFNLYYQKQTHHDHINAYLTGQKMIKESFQDIQFEPNTHEGHPYFKIIARLVLQKRGENIPFRPIFLVEKITKLQDYNQLTHHLISTMVTTHKVS